MTRTLLAATLAAAIANTSCTAAAVTGVVVGGAGTIGAVKMYEGNCSSAGCTYGNAMALILGVISVPLVIIGGVFLIREYQEPESTR